MNCTFPGCGKSWNIGQAFPLCIEYTCPLRRHRQEVDPPRRVWSSASRGKSSAVGKRSSTTSSIVAIQLQIKKKHKFKPYDVKGKQKAKTTVKLRGGKKQKFETDTQMHSEMRALEYMLNNGYWTFYLGTLVWAHNLQPITLADFQTDLPHCGYCTIFLWILGLPIGTATRGNYNYACHFSYPLPKKVRENVWVLARILDSNTYSGFNKIKALLNHFVSIPSDLWLLNVKNLALVDEQSYTQPEQNSYILLWDEIVAKEGGAVLQAIWALVFQCIYEANNKSLPDQ